MAGFTFPSAFLYGQFIGSVAFYIIPLLFSLKLVRILIKKEPYHWLLGHGLAYSLAIIIGAYGNANGGAADFATTAITYLSAALVYLIHGWICKKKPALSLAKKMAIFILLLLSVGAGSFTITCCPSVTSYGRSAA